jgi:membrane protein implicated in regulation of membrane protease activity
VVAIDGVTSAWLTGYGIAVVIACVVLAVEGRWGWSVALFLASLVVDALVVLAVRRRARRPGVLLTRPGGAGPPPRPAGTATSDADRVSTTSGR